MFVVYWKMRNKDRKGLFGLLGDVVEGVGNIGAEVAGTGTELLAGQENAEAVEGVLKDSVRDVADVIALDLTDGDDDSKGPLPKIVRVAIPGGTIISKILKEE